MTDAETSRPPPRTARNLIRLLVVIACALLAALALAWANRKTIAREALTGWLRAKGIDADAQVEAFGPSEFTARLRIGDPRNPDFAAERVEVRYRPRITGLEIVSVRLSKPVLRAQLRRDGLHVGALDPLVQDFLRRPPRPNAAQPRIVIEGGTLLLATDYGPMRMAADARVEDGKLQTLAATTAPARLRSPDFDVSLGAATVRAVTRQGRVDVSLAAPVFAAKFGQAQASDSRLTFSAQLPYPDVQTQRGDGAVVASLTLASRKLTLADQAVDGAALKVGLTGQARGWIPDLVVTGQATASLTASAGRFGGGEARALRAAAVLGDFAWARKDGDRVAGTLKLSASAEGVRAGDLRLQTLSLAADGPVAAAGAGIDLKLAASAVGQGGWTGLGAPAHDDAPDMAAVKRAARSFRFAAPAVALRFTEGAGSIGLPKPVRLEADGGGVAELAARGAAPLLGPHGGAFRLTVKGGGLPSLDADVAKLTLVEGGAVASGRVRARASLGLVQGADVDASGRLQIANGGLTFVADRCIPLRAERLDFGANDIERLSGRLCPTSEPLLRMTGADWRIAGRAEGVAATAPFVQGRVVAGAGRFVAQSRRGDVTVQAHVDTARQEDTAAETRFNPFLMTGDASLSAFIWRADLDFRLPNGTKLGNALVTQDGRLGLGVAVIETEMLTFAEGGLQPARISPLAASVGSPAVGQAKFKGRFDWTPEGSTSNGVVTIPRLDFQSPAGPVKGLKGELVFSSLAPLTAADGQQLSIERVDGPVLLENLHATYGVVDNLLKVEGGDADVGGGKVRVETLEIPLVPGAPTRGVLILDGVQLHDLVEASPFGDKVELDARVSGRVPFEMTGTRVRIANGQIHAVQPGRLSIARTALTGVSTDAPAATPAVPDPNATFTDFAYQAMENLAFDKLEASIASQSDGRLGVLFHIVGRHDPPQKQQIRLTLMDLIKRRFLGKPLPLPSGTGVNLTLDTTLNLDDLLADYADYQKTRSSAPVQP